MTERAPLPAFSQRARPLQGWFTTRNGIGARDGSARLMGTAAPYAPGKFHPSSSGPATGDEYESVTSRIRRRNRRVRPVDGGGRGRTWAHGSPITSRAALLGGTDIHLRSVRLATHRYRRLTERARMGLGHPRCRTAGLLRAPESTHLRQLRRIGPWGDLHSAS